MLVCVWNGLRPPTVNPHDYMVEWELWLKAAAQHHETTSCCILLAQEKTKIQN